MNLKLQAARNIGSNWLGLAVNIVVGFFLSPFILHRLGNTAFGYWILIFSSTGYYGLFDFGIRSSIIKHISEYTTKGKNEQINRIVSTALFGYSCLAFFLLALTAILARHLDVFFRISPESAALARQLFLIVGSCVALTFPLSVFGGILQGIQQFHWLNFIQIAGTLARALLIVIALNAGGGLLMVGFITAAFPLIGGVLNYFVTRWKLSLRISWKYVDRSAFRQLMNYSAVTFMIIVADRLRFQSDALIIGGFIGPVGITYFSIGSRLVDYATNIVDSLAETFMPISSQLDAEGDIGRQQRLLIAGNRLCALVMFPISALLLILGKSVISVWVGPAYVSSYTVMVLLLIPRTVYRAQGASNRILFGMARHKTLAYMVLIEGAANLLLSIIFTPRWGIVGNAVGTFIPLMLTSMFFLPAHLSRTLDVPLAKFLKEAYLPPLALCVPLVAVLLLMQNFFQPQNYLQLAAEVAAAGSIYAAAVLWYFFTYESDGLKLRLRISGYLRGKAGV